MKIAAFPDIHFPFSNDSVMPDAMKEVKKAKPDVIIQLGDLYDLFSFSKYPRSHSAVPYTPEQEVEEGRRKAVEFWKQLRKDNPKARLLQLGDANHDLRIVKRFEEKMPEAAFIGWRWLDLMLSFPGVEMVKSHVVVDGIMIEHGNRKAGQHAWFNQMSTLTGHTHKARIEYFANLNGPFWEFNCGWLADPWSPVFSYRNHNRIDDNHTGIGLIEDGQPRFLAL